VSYLDKTIDMFTLKIQIALFFAKLVPRGGNTKIYLMLQSKCKRNFFFKTKS
jgi:hypothetical protein